MTALTDRVTSELRLHAEACLPVMHGELHMAKLSWIPTINSVRIS
jgi:hypothetical protein